MSDIFRKRYQELHPERKELIESIKRTAEFLYNQFEGEDNREMTLAKINLEQAVMWAVKSITRNADQPLGYDESTCK